MFQTVVTLTLPICLATCVAFGLTLSAAMISARFSGGRCLLAALPAVSSMPAFLAIFQTVETAAPTCRGDLICVRVLVERSEDFSAFFCRKQQNTIRLAGINEFLDHRG
jgi:hypothetical protein